jgi:hypothetical protein
MIATTAAVSLGLLVGARHAFEPDHLAAVSTLVSTTRNAKSAAWLGVLWGLGHTLALLAVGIVLVTLDGALPSRAGAIFELVVAALLIVLGVRSIISGIRETSHSHPHAIAWRPITIGIVHGLAGSGALTALVFAELPTSGARVVYMIMFGAGSIAGMAIATGLAGVALQHVARGATTRRWLAITTGIVSCAVGATWAFAA